MEMVRVAIPKDSVFNGKRIAESNIRNDFHCMIVGIDRGLENLIRPLPDVEILSGDLLWVVGETADIKNLQLKANEVVAVHS
ncbi:MAG: TrkA C-terminal domain-containing protein, partial [Paludibacteraceae bacterium]|nr:TrkA C-terminal domain-containing protein [Paludibacteraceae bacterium]